MTGVGCENDNGVERGNDSFLSCHSRRAIAREGSGNDNGESAGMIVFFLVIPGER